MLFTEIKFFAFFTIVLLFYWTLQKNSHRKNFLLGISYIFYGSWDPRFAAMLFIVSSIDYALAREIDKATEQKKRKIYVVSSVVMNLGVLGFFKYCNFFVDSAIELASVFGVQLSQPTLDIILPVGISFLTFQSLSYTIDIYRRKLKPAKIMRDYLLFASFFPQLVAGPIVRAAYFLPQLTEKRQVKSAEIREYAILFLIGFIKKTCIADNIAPYVDKVFSEPELYSQIATFNAVWLYATQIYCDFSGYSDMAIAVAGFMGYRLVRNFNAPYLATSIQEFWRRWHISLSTWIRDYIYISLGGRSVKRFITYRNLMISMLAAGLWHGAAWKFIAWGGLHGFALIVNRELNRKFPHKDKITIIDRITGWFFTINFVCIAWIFFRAISFESGWVILKRYLFLEQGGALTLPHWLMLFPPALLLLQLAFRKLQWNKKMIDMPEMSFVVAYGICWALTLSILPLANRPFIYFQF